MKSFKHFITEAAKAAKAAKTPKAPPGLFMVSALAKADGVYVYAFVKSKKAFDALSYLGDGEWGKWQFNVKAPAEVEAVLYAKPAKYTIPDSIITLERKAAYGDLDDNEVEEIFIEKYAHRFYYHD